MMTEDDAWEVLRKLAAHYRMCENTLSRWRIRLQQRVSKREALTPYQIETEIRIEKKTPDYVLRKYEK